MATDVLDLRRCPHCMTANPNLKSVHHFVASAGLFPRSPEGDIRWNVYVCQSCGGVTAAGVRNSRLAQVDPTSREVIWLIPEYLVLDNAIPERARNYLAQARETLSSPSASILTSASSVDAMLKARGHKSGSLYSRIDAAAHSHLITDDMASWAHDVRLDANDERHADEDAAPPTTKDAQRCLEFAETLADILFVLPARVMRGRESDADES